MKKMALLGLILTIGMSTAAPVQGAVSKNQRRLLLVSALETFGQAKYAWLYSFLDASTISMGQSVLSGSYQGISVLKDSAATEDNFVKVLRNLTNLSSVKAVDVVLSLHGANNKLWFDDASVSTASLGSSLQQIPKRYKFRLLYSLACYGASHRNDFLDSGFRTAIGARKVNTASASEYPSFLAAWKAGAAVNSIFAATNMDPAMMVSDNAARGLGFNDPDSYKLVGGMPSLSISLNAY